MNTTIVSYFFKIGIVSICIYCPTLLNGQISIQAIEPAKATTGDTITLNGTGFNSDPIQNTVHFNMLKGYVISASANQLKVQIPPGATFGPVTVSANGFVAKSPVPFYPNTSDVYNPIKSSIPFSLLRYDTAGFSPGSVLADFDGDGKVDIANAGGPAGWVNVFKNNSTAPSYSFPRVVTLQQPGFVYRVVAEDFNGNGKPDLAVLYASGPSKLVIWPNLSTPGNISFGTPIVQPLSGDVYHFALADFDNDGRIDIATGTQNGTSVAFFLNTSAGSQISFVPANVTNSVPSIITLCTADIDSDGKADIVTGTNAGNSVGILKNTTTGFGQLSFESALISGMQVNSQVEVASLDVNSDNKLDLIFAANHTQAPDVWINQSSPQNISFSKAATNFTNITSGFITACDPNFDGKTDFIVSSFNTNGNSSMYENILQAPNYLKRTNYSFNSYPAKYTFHHSIGDLNNNGMLEMVSTSFSNGGFEITMLPNKPYNLFSFDPEEASEGMLVIIKGSLLKHTKSVLFGNIPAASFQVINDSVIHAYAAPGSGSTITISGQHFSASKGGFRYFNLPKINSFLPDTGFAGSKVKILGENLNETKIVKFGNIPAASFKIISPTEIEAIVGLGSSGHVLVAATEIDSSRLDGFKFYPAPKINSISSLSGKPGSEIIINGEEFLYIQKVMIGNTPVTSFEVENSQKIRAILPEIVAGGAVKVFSPYGEAAYYGFYNGARIDSISPVVAKSGDTIVIHGQNFETDTHSVHIKLGYAKADIVEMSANKISITTPNGPPVGKISVTCNGHTIQSVKDVLLTFESTTDTFGLNTLNEVIPAGFLQSKFLISGSNFLVADFDLDGKPDILYSYLKTIMVLKNTSGEKRITFGDNIFTLPIVAPSGISRIFIADLNFDGKPDIIFETFGITDVGYLLNTSIAGTISFSAYKQIPLLLNSIGINLFDIDKDGKPDIINRGFIVSTHLNYSNPDSIKFNPFYNYYYLNNTSLSYYAPTIYFADLDNDNFEEVIVDNSQTSFQMLKVHAKPGIIDSLENVPIEGNQCTYAPHLFADFDGDNQTDMVTFCPSTQFFSKRNKSTPGNFDFEEKQHLLTNRLTARYTLSKVADMNGDGKPDIIALDLIGKLIDVFINISKTGEIDFAAPISFPAIDNEEGWENSYYMEIADFDADGKPDILVTGKANSLAHILRNSFGEYITKYFCAGSPGSVKTSLAGVNYQWQYSPDGIIWTTLSNEGIYTGTQSNQLSIQHVGISLNQHLYRCIVDGKPDKPFQVKFENIWKGDIDNLWSNPANWSCGTVPFGDIDVEIYGNVLVDIDVEIGSITLGSGATLQTSPNVKLTVLR